LFLRQAAQFTYFTYRKIRHTYFGDTSPVVAAIKVTQRCNLKCTHCTWVNKITNDLPLGDWKKIIDGLYKRGCGIVFIEGGEPTLRNDLSEIIGYIKAKGMFCVLFTNGTRCLDGLTPDAFWFSIDGTEKSHDAIRGKGTYKKVMETLRKYPEKNILSITTLSKINADEIEDICVEFSKANIRGIIFNFMYPYKDVSKDSLAKEKRIECAKEIFDKKSRFPKIASSDSYLKSVGKENKLCYPWLLLLVTADGKITHGCTVEPVEERNCEACDMMCGLEASLGFELDNGSLYFWGLSGILPQSALFPEWSLSLLRKNTGK